WPSRASTARQTYLRQPSQRAVPASAAPPRRCSDRYQESAIMFFIRKKLPRAHALGEPILHANHSLPVTRRQMIGAGLVSAPAMVVGPAWLAAALKPGKANALDSDIATLTQAAECNIAHPASGIPFIVFDLAGGANLVNSEILAGQKGGQSNFLSTAGYGKMGVPGNMVPSAAGFFDSSFGALWHSDGAILRGMKTKI